jgi:septal ring factor EnvC (AmiA/AmiB activator)
MTQATDTDIREIRDLLLGLDKKIDGVDKKLDIHMAKTEEQLKGIDARFAGIDARFTGIDAQLADIKVQLRSQDNRLWTFVAALFIAGFGFFAKFAFFPAGQP